MPLPRLPRRRTRRTADVPAFVPPPVLRTPRAAAWWISLAVILVGGAVGGTMWWLLADLAAQAPTAPAGQQPAAVAGSALGEVLRTALAAGAGVGAGITLALAFRRQRQLELHNAVTTQHADRVATMTEHDATERRVTDLYTKAVEQLGHDKAAVRLGGLYALERVAQDNPGHRQTIVNVICAYLRMPYTPPAPPDPEQERKQALRRAVETALLVAPATDTPSAAGADPEGERQVRLTAQTILTDHLRDTRAPDQREIRTPAGSRFWEDMHIDLTDATLLDFDFHYCHATQARFSGATFTGNAWFDGATFTGPALFGEATFTGNARFDKATFTGNARFDKATFTGNAGFGGATFTGNAGFGGATFTGNAGFDEATFTGNARFDKATFTRAARFVAATFTGAAWFIEATFTGTARFSSTTFTNAVFGGATFREAWFDGATFNEDAQFNEAIFARAVQFAGATFTGNARFDKATFTRAAWFDGAAFDQPPHWPEGWQLKVTENRTRLVKARRPVTGSQDGP